MKRRVMVIAICALAAAACSSNDSNDSDDTMAAADSGADMEAFCEQAITSNESREEAQVNAYYDELSVVAPEGLKADIATLRSGWMSVSMDLGDAISGEVQDVSRPPEVSEAARNVMRTVLEECDFDGGVYLVLPEAGL